MNMFYGASPGIFEKAKWLRENMTVEERKLWDELKDNRIRGYRFKPQHPINVFIADFYCHRLKLVIEVDGGVHMDIDQQDYDRGRTHELNHLGIKVIRFSNEEVQFNMQKVLDAIAKKCKSLEGTLNSSL